MLRGKAAVVHRCARGRRREHAHLAFFRGCVHAPFRAGPRGVLRIMLDQRVCLGGAPLRPHRVALRLRSEAVGLL